MRIIIILILIAIACSCNKDKFLSKKPDQSLSIPTQLQEYQAILDNDAIMNGFEDYSGVDPNFLLIASDDYYLPQNRWVNIPNIEFRNLYTFNDNIYGIDFTNWDRVYLAIFHANVALEGIELINFDKGNEKLMSSYNNIKGSSLFFRARFFYQLAQLYSPMYDPNTADKSWGVILRLQSDINEKLQRATVKQTYEQIISDLKSATIYLPQISTSPHKTRPSKAAAFAMLSKTYLIMRDFENSRKYADSCLKIQNELMNFNTLNLTATFPFSRDNSEIIFYSMANVDQRVVVSPIGARIDSNLYMNYNEKDLRRQAYFQSPSSPRSENDVVFKGSYDGYYNYFTGIAVDEILLIRAETNARTNRLNDAVEDLNTLMSTRWKDDGSFIPFHSSNQDVVLKQILLERRKELIQRGTRWSDIRRLNLEGADINITRILDGSTYVLKANDLRSTFLIPPNVMAFNPEMPQNPR